MRLLYLFSLIFFAFGCSSSKGPKTVLPFTFSEISHGLYINELDEVEKSDMSPTGFQSYVKNVELVMTCDTIVGKIGTDFGIQYTIQTARDKTFVLNKVWELPSDMINDKGKKFQKIERRLTVDTNATLSALYSFDKEYEIIKGNWILKLFHKDILIYEKRFVVK